jgi:ribonuclease E
VERERYGRSSTRYPEPVRQSQPQSQAPRRRDERPQRQPIPQQHRSGGGAPFRTGRDSAEPWSEVPPELEELLRAQLSTKLSLRGEAPVQETQSPVETPVKSGAAEGAETAKIGARRGRRKVESVGADGVEAAAVVAETPAGAVVTAAKPAPRTRRKAAPVEAAVHVAEAVAEAPSAPAAVAPKRRAPARKKAAPAEGEAPTEATGEPAGE